MFWYFLFFPQIIISVRFILTFQIQIQIQNFHFSKDIKFPLTPMGVLAPMSVHKGPSAQPPIDVSGNFPASVSAKSSSNISPKC